jgi:dTDP-4-dehydrorhamnose reductase
MNAKKSLIVTGAHGFVAGSVLAQAGDEWQVHAMSRSLGPEGPSRWHWHACDPLKPGELAAVFREVKAEAVIHTAATADIDFCQQHPELACGANVELTRHVTDLCRETGARLVFCSTDTIFDGEHAPYKEEDTPGPVNLYAETKVEAERIVQGLGLQAVIARLSLVVGLPVLGAGNSFFARMVAALREGRSVGMTEYEIRTPVDVITVGRVLLELAAGSQSGIFHIAGSSQVNRFELAQTAAARFGLPRSLIIPQPANSTPGRAARPRDVSLSNRKAAAKLKTPMRTLDEGLSLILEWASRTSPL